MITPVDLVFGLFAGFSLAANLAQYFLSKRSNKKRPLSISAEEIVHDLTRGIAVVRIERISQEDLFLRSPRS